jgi:hypothetical protein
MLNHSTLMGTVVETRQMGRLIRPNGARGGLLVLVSALSDLGEEGREILFGWVGHRVDRGQNCR